MPGIPTLAKGCARDFGERLEFVGLNGSDFAHHPTRISAAILPD